MIQTPEERRPPLTPQLALRVAVVGTVALAMFAVIFFRLWFLQVLNGQAYVRQAQVNQVRSITIPAPRGRVYDSSGNVLVDNTKELDVVVSPANLPVRLTQLNIGSLPAADEAVYRRLANVLGISTQKKPCKLHATIFGRYYGTLRLAQIPCAIDQQLLTTPYADVRIKQGVSQDVQYYLAERQDQFPGVQVQQVYVRKYPLGSLAAQLFGTVGPLSPQDLSQDKAHFKNIPHSDYVGQSGLEYYYNQYLQGKDGTERFQVNAYGDFNGDLPGASPQAGDALKLSLNVPLQRVGQQALQQSMNSNAAPAGAFVAMNPDDGQIYAMGSLPTFDPNIFTKPVPSSVYNELNSASSGYPLFNRAIQSVGPTGSTFKAITATAALQSGKWSIGDTYDDTGQFCEGGGLCRRNAGGAAYGVLDLVEAIHVSDDVFFYNLGALLNSQAPLGGDLQKWARLFGIGRPTGVDLGGENPGTLPTPAWRAQRNAEEAACDRKHHLAPGGCGIADGTNRPWSVGDNVNLAVGQGDVQVTPLQLAVAYSAIANGGTIVRPHVAQAVENADGTVLQKIDPPPARHLHIDPANLDAIRQGLNEAAQSPGGTSYDVMGNFGQKVYGKTGTAQYNGQNDYAWYVCFVPDWATNKPILVAVHVEQGGFGDIAAAPVAREILSQWFYGKPGSYQAGGSRTL